MGGVKLDKPRPTFRVTLYRSLFGLFLTIRVLMIPEEPAGVWRR